MTDRAAAHDAYAAGYDAQVAAYESYIAEVLFGLCYAFVRPGQRLLDAGIGTGLAAAPFARAGLRVSGMDFSPAMLDLCRAKGIAADLQCHDIARTPWPYPAASFDHVICCGVLHFLPDLEPIFAEAGRLLPAGGLFAFTTKAPTGPTAAEQKYEQQFSDQITVYSHVLAHVETALAAAGLARLRRLRCFVGPELFALWVARQAPPQRHEDDV